MCRVALFRMGIQSGRVSRVVLEMSKFQHLVRAHTVCPYGDGSRRLVIDFDPILLIPSRSPNILQSIESVAETSTRKSIHPNYLHRRAYQPPSPDPHDRSRGGGFFCQRFFARLEMDTSDVTYACGYRLSA